METKTVESLDDVSDEELDKMLDERSKKRQREQVAKRKKYEKDREEIVLALIGDAKLMSDSLQLLKQDAFGQIKDFEGKMREYGDINGKSKGGYSLRSADDQVMIKYSSQNIKSFDERADLAEEKLMLFLEGFIKKRNKKIYKLVLSLLERSSNGEFDVTLINRLYKMENDFTEPMWTEAIALFKEAYCIQNTVKYITFHKRNADEKWETIQLNFSSIKF